MAKKDYMFCIFYMLYIRDTHIKYPMQNAEMQLCYNHNLEVTPNVF